MLKRYIHETGVVVWNGLFHTTKNIRSSFNDMRHVLCLMRLKSPHFMITASWTISLFTELSTRNSKLIYYIFFSAFFSF